MSFTCGCHVTCFQDWKRDVESSLTSLLDFFPSIVQTLGYPRVQTLLLTSPPYFLACIFSLLNSWHSGKTLERSYHICAGAAISVVGQVLSTTTHNLGARYFVSSPCGMRACARPADICCRPCFSRLWAPSLYFSSFWHGSLPQSHDPRQSVAWLWRFAQLLPMLPILVQHIYTHHRMHRKYPVSFCLAKCLLLMIDLQQAVSDGVYCPDSCSCHVCVCFARTSILVEEGEREARS